MPNIYELRYEDLVNEPESKLKEVCGHLKIQFEPEMLNSESRRNESALVEQVGDAQKLLDQPIQKTRSDAAQGCPVWVDHLLREEADTLVDTLGYPLRPSQLNGIQRGWIKLWKRWFARELDAKMKIHQQKLGVKHQP